MTRYIPVPTGNAYLKSGKFQMLSVYPCTHRERLKFSNLYVDFFGISLYPQGTRIQATNRSDAIRYIPVPTGNAIIMWNKL